ncbi:(2E,6E)-farnesyl diphosphate synthase [Kangiella sediminilitoris]|uniref:Farnesyl-diphosphate synthase n=1 Tax=Kangiella sediminilitoris TaxID=1144748 RepID=A0A1B3BCX7_9GAMM|nr:farnesyl diphosphate synthase [Kangiella sediminilitoris]AOE50652.1 farnesyl-diphosphate synthase [Kangiella sediminilitoris]
MNLENHLQQWQSQVAELLKKRLPAESSSPHTLHQAMRYGALNGGKRIRPVLVFATGEAFGANKDDLTHPALAVELIHCYSLVHDDLPAMDDDDLRRGKPTCHIQFNEATAILAGDALHTQAFEELSKAKLGERAAPQQLEMIQLLAQASGSLGMGGGQAIDLESTQKSIDLDMLENMHRMKTGALIKVSVLLGALCAGPLQKDERQALEDYADAIGLAFQVKDDILDIESDTETLGKPQGSDVANQKNTYPALLGIDGSRQKLDDLLQLALQALAKLPYNTQILADLAKFIVHRNA